LTVTGSSNGGAPDIAEFNANTSGNTLVKVASTGAATLNAHSDDIVGLTILANGSQTADLLDIGSSGGLFKVTAKGNVTGGAGTFSAGSQASTVGLTVTGSSDATTPDVADFVISGGG